MEGTFTGDVYTDGSLRQLWWWLEAARAGWGIASLEGLGLKSGLTGTLPGPVQTVPRAEMFAVCEVLRLAVLPLHVHTDHLPIVDGLKRGRAWCLAVARNNADLWRELWHRIDELGG